MTPVLIGIIVSSIVLIILIVVLVAAAIENAKGTGQGNGSGATDPSGSTNVALAFVSTTGSGLTRVATTNPSVTYDPQLSIPGVVSYILETDDATLALVADTLDTSLETGFELQVEQEYHIIEAASTASALDILQNINIAFIGNFPAISYTVSNAVWYVRALDVFGTSWASPTLVEDSLLQSHAVVHQENSDGLPFIVSNRLSGIYLWRASNNEGTSWPSTAVTIIDSVSIVKVQFLMINGIPSVGGVRSVGGSNTCFFTQAFDSSGDTWPDTLMDVDTAEPSSAFSMIAPMIGEFQRPAFAFVEENAPNNVYFVLSGNTYGSVWGTQRVVSTVTADPTSELSCTLMDNLPVVLFFQPLSVTLLKVSIANDAAGASWGPAYSVHNTRISTTNNYCNVTSADSTMLFVTYKMNLIGQALNFTQSSDAGSVWTQTRAEIDSPGTADRSVGNMLSMISYNNLPMVAYADEDLQTVRFVSIRSTYSLDWNVEQQQS